MSSKREYLRHKAELDGIEDMTHDQVVLIAEHLLQEYDTFEEVRTWFRHQYGHRYCPDRTQAHLERIIADTRDGHETDVKRHEGQEDGKPMVSLETAEMAICCLGRGGEPYIDQHLTGIKAAGF